MTLSIRARLLIGMVALVSIGLTAAAVVTYEEQRSFLLDRVQQQAQAALVPVGFRLTGQRRGGFGVGEPKPGSGGPAALLAAEARRERKHLPGTPLRAALPPGTFGALLSPTGRVLRRQVFSYGEQAPPEPSLPRHPQLSKPGAPLAMFDLRSSGGTRWRAAAFAIGSEVAVVAIPLTEVEATLGRLVTVELLVGVGVILALVVLGWAVIRLGLRPLERIGRVASEIAGGDLSRRVRPAEGRTEVGRLGSSLNEMLAQIERAFADRSSSEKRLRQFIADASHELRTPLQAIRGYAELFRLGATDDPETLERAMSRIESEAARMGVLVDDLLLLASLDQAPERAPVAVDLAALADQAAQDARVLAPERELTVALRRPAVVLGDADRLRQMVGNLLRNAIIHTPAGSPIELRVTTGENGRVELRVRDHGSGLPPGAGDQVFERFWRAESGRSRGRGGAGLGLAIVRAVATAHGGEVAAANAPGGGAEFTVSLPAFLVEKAPAPGDSQESLSVLTSSSYLPSAQ
ncbi:MAG: sensor histidine kinase [Solirubrobacteraceae bacterium]